MIAVSLPGGGLFAYVQARVLALVKPANFARIKVFAGTSGGGINSCAYAAGMDVTAVPKLWKDLGPAVFKGHWWKQYNYITTPKYGDAKLNKLLSDNLPGQLGSARVPVFITAHNMSAGKAKVFYSGDADDGQWPLWEVARITAAAQTYLPVWKNFADGGLFFNDPSVALMAGVHSEFGIEPNDLYMVSIGTGASQENYTRGNPGNYIKWIKIILEDTLHGGSVFGQRFVANELLGPDHYLVCDFPNDSDMGFDNPDVPQWIDDNWSDQIVSAAAQIDRFVESISVE